MAVGCLAERYGAELADSLPEADAVLGFDDYPDIADRLRSILAGEPQHAHTPAGPAQAAADLAGRADRAAARPARPGRRRRRRRLDAGPMAPLKLASGCDRRCTFCAIPSFRGSFVSRRPSDVLAEARWLADQGVRELFLVSENSTSYGKDLGDLRLLETLLPELAAVDGVERVRVSYLQPAETRPGLVDGDRHAHRASRRTSTCPSSTPARRCCAGCAASATPRAFLGLLDQVRAQAPEAGRRGPTSSSASPARPSSDLEIAVRLPRRGAARRRSASSATPTRTAPRPRASTASSTRTRSAPASRTSPALVEELTAQRAEERIGEQVEVLVESLDGPAEAVEGRAAHQGPEVDGSTHPARSARGPGGR